MTRLPSVIVVVALWAQLMVKHTDAQGELCRPAEGGQGVCQAIRHCAKLRALLTRVRNQRNPSPESQDILRKSVCKFLGPEPLVCCPREDQTPAPPPATGDGGISLLPDNCGGRGILNRIIDGENAPLGFWPWIVVFRGFSGSKQTWFCGGSLINKRYVLTAAHCFRSSSTIRPLFARIGEHNLATDPDCADGLCAPKPQDIQFDVILHPQYNKGCSHCNDIALIRLKQDVIMDEIGFVRPICLPVDPEKDMGFRMSTWQNLQAVAAGWGSTARDHKKFVQPDILQQVSLPLKELNYCRSLKRNYFEPQSVMCAGGLGQDTCRADSGGPLTLGNSVDTKRFLIGLTSLGPVECGSANSQGLYTNVHHYIDWILATIRP
ncbi:unnamed protein product [Meganyctiphanes norvegica]|uniref:CLIP domain-containing serine protease n=1 Tax=Meganyctiphanes norvegica TaxID=48144 RepID=A0AAV2PUC9_MEGNR